MLISLTILLTSLLVLYYIYDGYGRVLQLLASNRKVSDKKIPECTSLPSVTVILPVYNEEERISEKINDIVSQSYPGDLDLIVISDGSTDRTDDIVSAYEQYPVELIRTTGRLGKSLAQNMAVERAKGEILLLTDAAVRMEPDCIKELVEGFQDQCVGCVTGELQFRAVDKSVVAENQSSYWRYELKLRQLESELGWLAVAAGPLMAVRKRLWVPLQSWYGDDCVIPLDVVLQEMQVRHMEKARGWDESFNSASQEFNARVRMTIRNWQGTFYRSELLNPFHYPGYSFALYSHKILRWLSPFWLVGVLIGFTGIMFAADAAGSMLAAVAAILSGFIIFSVVVTLRGIKIPLVSTVANFSIVNMAFAIGVVRALAGKSIRVYQNK